MGELSLDITNIKRELRLYFIQQLVEDESIRSEHMLDSKFNHLSTSEVINSIIELYKESLRGEVSQGLERAIEVADSYSLDSDVESQSFKRFYREFIKIEIELLQVLLKCEHSDYSVEGQYLYDNKVGLSSSVVGVFDKTQCR